MCCLFSNFKKVSIPNFSEIDDVKLVSVHLTLSLIFFAGLPAKIQFLGIDLAKTLPNPKILPETNVAVFHGEPNPHQCIDPWCKENWK